LGVIDVSILRKYFFRSVKDHSCHIAKNLTNIDQYSIRAPGGISEILL